MVIIIGAGLSGLLTAYRLKKEGIPFKILEARNRIGGRINTIYGTNQAPVEMGATWFNSHHKHLLGLLEELGINHFEQKMDSTVFYQNSASTPTQTIQIPGQAPSFRIDGGTSNLIQVLFDKLDKRDILLNQSVTRIKLEKDSLIIRANSTFEASRAVLAIPPKLWAKKIAFEPSLPKELMEISEQTHTWMEDSIKVALTYSQAFWQEENVPGTLFSNPGPVTEFYDHCNLKRNKFALCGFIHSSFKELKPADRRAAVLTQLKSIFGVWVENYINYQECVWSEEENTFEASDQFLFPHQNNGNPIFNSSFFDDKLLISSAESASEFPGYMDGAVYSANVNAKRIIHAYQNV